MRVGIFKDCNNLCYGTLNFFAEQLGNALAAYGISVSYLDRIGNDSLRESFDLLIGFNIPTLSGMKVGEEYLLDMYGCPFVHFIVDPPYYYHESLQSQMKNQYFVFLDTEHEKYYKQYCAPCKDITIGYLLGPVGKTIPFMDRNIDILHTGSVYDIQSAYDDLTQADVPDMLRDLYVFLIECGKNQPQKRTIDLINGWLSDHGLAKGKEEYWPILMQVATQAEHYLRSYYRIKIINTLLEAGLKVHIAGNGWEQYFPKHLDNLVLEGSVPYEQAGELTAHAKILLNVMPWFKDGFHDRIPTAMLNKSICLTDSSSYIDEHFQNGHNIVLYNLSKLEELPSKCYWLLEHPEESMCIADAGYQKVSKEYTWENLILKILKMTDLTPMRT